MIGYLLAALGGLAAMYFADPDRGKRRRAMARDRLAGTMRRAGALGGRVQRKAVTDAYGYAQKLRHPGFDQEPPPNDAALAQKVMTELFRDQRIPKGSINVSAEAGIVQLRGKVEHPETIREIEDRVRAIPGVAGVESFLHLPETPARGR